MTKIRSLTLLAALVAVLAVAGCAGDGANGASSTSAHSGAALPTTSSTTGSFSITTLTTGISAAGLDVRATAAGGECIFGSAATPQELAVSSTTVIQVFTFVSESLAQQAASQVSKDGSSITQLSPDGKFEGCPQIEWKGRVHFYRQGRVIALYVESGARPAGQAMVKQDALITTVLERVMGSPFAGM